jgi:hypothetical protein
MRLRSRKYVLASMAVIFSCWSFYTYAQCEGCGSNPPLYPDSFVVESVSFSPRQPHIGDTVTAKLQVSLLEPQSNTCPYVKCWAQMLWPTRGRSYLDGSCTMKQIDPTLLEVTVKHKVAEGSPTGYYSFEGLSLQASCHDYAFYYDGPRSRFQVVD